MNEKKYEYQMQLINRRWQYFAAYLLVFGLLSNSIPKELFEKPEILAGFKNQIAFFLLVIIVVGIIFSQLVSLTTKRIESIELTINKNESVTNLRLEGQFLGLSETILLYTMIYLANTFLTYFLLDISITLFLIITVIQVINLFFLKWKASKRI
jgi:hypothetical protein